MACRVIHDSMVMYHITAYDRPLLGCRLVEKEAA